VHKSTLHRVEGRLSSGEQCSTTVFLCATVFSSRYSISCALQCLAALFLVSLSGAVLSATCGQGGNDFCRARWLIM
jgi:hypothetical protein